MSLHSADKWIIAVWKKTNQKKKNVEGPLICKSHWEPPPRSASPRCFHHAKPRRDFFFFRTLAATPSHSVEEARARMSNAECFPPKLKACLLLSEHRPGVCHPALRGGREQDKRRHLLLHLLHPGWPPRGGAWELPHQEGGQRTAGKREREAYLLFLFFVF